MNDDLPTAERLRRIERGVQRRIGLRRLVGRRIAVAAVAVVVVAGGFALLRPVVGGTASTSAAGSAASVGAPPAAAVVPVECDGARTVTTHAETAGLPASALAACALAERGPAARPDSGGGAGAPAPTARTLCRTAAGALHVYAGPPTVCATHGMARYAG